MTFCRIAMTAAVGTLSLLAVGPARAELVGPCVHKVQDGIIIDGAAWDVWRVYIEMDDPTDAVEFISGNSAHPIVITSLDGPFYQNEDVGANDIEPNGLLFEVLPDLEWDTFVTLGRSALDFDAGPTVTQYAFPPNAPGFQDDELVVDGGAWYRLPGNPATLAGTELKVMIGQFTVPHGGRLDGVVRIAVRIGDDTDVHLDQTFASDPSGCDCSICPGGLIGDTNGDNVVDVDDLINVIGDWGTDGSASGGDVDGNGIVDIDDLMTVLLAMAPPA